MSETIDLSVLYDAPYGTEALRAAFEAVRLAVAENWDAHRDRLSDPAPRTPIDIEAWLHRASPERMHGPSWDPHSPIRFSDSLEFNYSPVSGWLGLLKTMRCEDGTISISCWVCDRAETETGEYRLKTVPDRRPEPPPDAYDPDREGYAEWWAWWLEPFEAEVWASNRLCLLHIAERLREALPVREVHLDERLLEDQVG